MKDESKSKGKKLLLMGSSAFGASELPTEVKERIDKAIDCGMRIIVGEARGASRLSIDREYCEVRLASLGDLGSDSFEHFFSSICEGSFPALHNS